VFPEVLSVFFDAVSATTPILPRPTDSRSHGRRVGGHGRDGGLATGVAEAAAGTAAAEAEIAVLRGVEAHETAG
jgi:hypothetical protein